MRSNVIPITTDVLIVGGGIAGCNAAIAMEVLALRTVAKGVLIAFPEIGMILPGLFGK